MELRFQGFINYKFEIILKDEMLQFEVLVGHLLATAEQSCQISQPVMWVVELRIQLVQEWDRRRTVVNRVINILLVQKAENVWSIM
jgi:hypothetical protein